VTGGAAADRAFGSNVSTNIFETLGVRPAEGHFFSSAEEAVGQDQVIVLSDGFWRQQFGGDHSVIGRTMMLDGVSREIIGVAPPQTHFPDFETQFWIPIAFKPGDPVDPWAVFGYQAIGRLRDGIQPSQAQAELRSLHREMLTLFPWRMPDNLGGRDDCGSAAQLNCGRCAPPPSAALWRGGFGIADCVRQRRESHAGAGSGQATRDCRAQRAGRRWGAAGYADAY
jgi:hypothetical protein